jgi:hypothetical protein
MRTQFFAGGGGGGSHHVGMGNVSDILDIIYCLHLQGQIMWGVVCATTQGWN